MEQEALLAQARKTFHTRLIDWGVLGYTVKKGVSVASNADVSQAVSKAIGDGIMSRVLDESQRQPRKPLSGQGLGAQFEVAVCDFMADTFPHLGHLRPGDWIIKRLGNKNAVTEKSFAQYEHLAKLAEAVQSDPVLQAALGNDYVVAPDIIVARRPEPDGKINAPFSVVDDAVAGLSDLRQRPTGEPQRAPILHASISAKWTMRSDRAQNSRTEALNLIRNRKGQTPHIVVVTGEPSPSRLASLALGTGDIDCLYHAFLPELVASVDELEGREDLAELVHTLVDGKRLKDIADLPLDLAI